MKRSLQKHLRWISMVIMLGNAAVYAQDKVTCKASVVFHGQELSGRMMFKQVQQDTVLFAFFNELGMSFVEGSMAVGGEVEILRISDFLDHKSFKRNFERGLKELIIDQETGEFQLLDEPQELVYRRGNKFIFKLMLYNSE